MPQYEPTQQIIALSLEELKFILDWIKKRGEPADKPTTVLIGGWAVDAYNPWYGSIDIDLITNASTKRSLLHALRVERGFERQRTPSGPTMISKPTPHGPIIIDLGSRSDRNNFEGRKEELSYGLLDGQTTVKNTRGATPAPVPTRTLLLLFKLKAAWDRAYRVEHETSNDPEWEKGKLVKDYADIIALIDPAHGGTEIDLSYLGAKFQHLPFLKELLKRIPESRDALQKYGRTDKEALKSTMDRLLALT